jgi:ABC-2 type transport system permease protein
VLAGTTRGSAALQWAGVPVGIASGVLCAWLLGEIARRQLAARGPDLLHLMRTGTVSQAKPTTPEARPLPRGKAFIVTLCWSIFWLPLFPQGLVPLVFKLVGIPVRSWFLALYLPAPFQWPTIFAMIALGLAIVYVAVTIQRQHDQQQRREAPVA